MTIAVDMGRKATKTKKKVQRGLSLILCTFSLDKYIIGIYLSLGKYCCFSHPYINIDISGEQMIQKISGPEVIKYFSCSTQLSMKSSRLIIVKMPTIVGILTNISMINTTSESMNARNVFIFQQFFNEQLKFHARLS